MKRVKLPAALLALLLLLSGCQSGMEASSLTVVTGIGLDGLPRECRVSVEAIQLTQTQEGGQRVLLHADGVTLSDSILNTVAITGRRLHSNHAEVLVISRETAEAGLEPVLDDLLRQNQYPVSMQLAIAKGSAEEIMRTEPVVGDIGSIELDTMLQEGQDQCRTPAVTASEFYQQACRPGAEPVLPFVELRQNGETMVREVTGCALFRDMKLLSILDGWESRVLLWMLGRPGGSLIGDTAIFEMEQLERHIDTGREGGVLTLTVTLKTQADQRRQAELEEEARRLLAEQCQAVLSVLQAQQCDAIGIGSSIYRHHPALWRQVQDRWPEIFSDYPIEVRVKIREMRWGRVWSAKNLEEWEVAGYGK